jgi:predicted small lipoprotein YifL
MKTVTRCLALVAVLFLAACGTFAPKEVLVPVAVKCDVDMPDVPVWATKSLKQDAGIFDQAKALLAERIQAAGYQDELRTALQECAEEIEPEDADEPEDSAE